MSDQLYIKEGWLMKRSRVGRVVPNWRRRYFRLSRTELLYFKIPKEAAPRRCYKFTLDSKVHQVDDQGYNRWIVVQPGSDQPDLYLQTENEVDKHEWLTALQDAIRCTCGVLPGTKHSELSNVKQVFPVGFTAPTPLVPPAQPAPSARVLFQLVVEEARKLRATDRPATFTPSTSPAATATTRILLNVVVEEARKLRNADPNKKSDPFCIVKLVSKEGLFVNTEEKRTEWINSTLNPVWKKSFTLGKVVDLNSVNAIQFDLVDHDKFGKHGSLGSVQVPLSRFRLSPVKRDQSEVIDDWFCVEPPLKTNVPSPLNKNRAKLREDNHAIQSWGELRVKMSMSGPNLADFVLSPELLATTPVTTAIFNQTDHRLEITIMDARGLVSTDATKCYCEMILLDVHGHPIAGECAKTATLYQTCNPVWADEHHVFGFVCPIEYASSLKIRVVGNDNSNRIIPLGFVCVDLDLLSAHKRTELHELQPEEGMKVRENLGVIEFKIWMIGERPSERARQQKIDKEVNMKTHNLSIEQLELEKARHQLNDAACKLDGARIPCALTDYQRRDPRFYGINGCINYLNSQIHRSRHQKVTCEGDVLLQCGLDSQAVLDVTIMQISVPSKRNNSRSPSPYAVVAIDPATCMEECRHTSKLISPKKGTSMASVTTAVVGSRDAIGLARDPQKMSLTNPSEKSLSILSFCSDTQSKAEKEEVLMANCGDSVHENKNPETRVNRTQSPMSTAASRKEKYLLSYAGMLNDAKNGNNGTISIHLRVYEARLLAVSSSPERRISVGSLNLRSDPDVGAVVRATGPQIEKQRAMTNAFFTVIPVLDDGKLYHTEWKQSLTIYGTPNPHWPEQEFVFGKIKDIAAISHISLYVYERELQGDVKQSLSNLLSTDEKILDVRLERSMLHKLSSSGAVEDDGFEILQYGQRVMAFRRCYDGGRFYPAHVQKYIPFPFNEYDIRFEDEIETIDDFWNLLSIDVKGKVWVIRRDGRVDVLLDGDDMSTSCTPPTYQTRCTVKASQITPVFSLTKQVEIMMARRVDVKREETDRWEKLKHKCTGFVIDILSASNLVMAVREPGIPMKLIKPQKPICLITLLGKAHSQPTIFSSFNSDGELVVHDSMESSVWSWKANDRLEAFVHHANAQSNDMHLFQPNPIIFGTVQATSVSADDVDQLSTDKNKMDKEKAILSHISSILIRVMDNTDICGAETVIGMAKLDLASLQSGKQDLHLQVIPPDEAGVPYYTFTGSLFVRMTCVTTRSQNVLVPQTLRAKEQESAAKDELNERRVFQCGLSVWYQRQLVNEESPSCTLQTRIKCRELLRLSLSPTENMQIGALHTVLVIVMKRIVSILREIRQFEEYDALPDDAKRECRLVHNVNADLDSQWLGKPITELPNDTRNDIIVQLDLELLDIAAIPAERVSPATNISRDEWIRARTARQNLLRENDCFFMHDQTTGTARMPPVLRSFTGEGIISWILRSPPVLWADKWTKYCQDSTVLSSCRLGWDDPSLDFDPDAIQAPRTREYALQWLSALCAAGFIEFISSGNENLRKQHTVMQDTKDRHYRLREVEMWMQKQSRENSVFPLDLVQEIDIRRTSDALPIGCSPEDTRNKLARPLPVIGFDRSKTYSKSLTEYCDGLLGVRAELSNLVFSSDVQKMPILPPNEDKTYRSVDEHVSWCWKYSLFVPSRKCLYIYEGTDSVAPVTIIDMTCIGCRVGYDISKSANGEWLEVTNASVCVKQPNSQDIFPVSSELIDQTMSFHDKGENVIKLKTNEPQRWAESFFRAGVSVNLCPGQAVIVKQLNPKALEQKCIDCAAEFDHHDLEGSYHRLLNRVFGHDKDFSHKDHENRQLQLRAQIRNELKKTGVAGDTVMAYYGKGVRFKGKPKHGGNFRRDSLYAGRVVRIRTPYTDPTYKFTTLYDRKCRTEAPAAVDELLNKYQVSDKASWMNLTIPLRDVFLLYDVEYVHDGDSFIEEGLMREHIRTNDGDLDPQKVKERCTNLNILFKSVDLDNCVTRIVKGQSEHKLLGILNIPMKTIPTHRTIDTWYPLSPAPNMLQKANRGQMRVELKLIHEKGMNRSKKNPPILETVKSVASSKPDSDQTYSDKSRSPEMSFSVVREPSFVKITIVECRKLRVADVLAGDPFVEILLVHEGLSIKEHHTNLKTDLKLRTLNPTWEKQEFVLGETEITALSDKKCILLRVMDYKATSVNEPLGCVKIKFQRSKTGYIKGLVLEHADLFGKSMTEELLLDQHNRARVDARLLPATGQPKPKARKTPTTEGVLGKIRFSIELMRNDSYVDLGAVTNVAEITAGVKMREPSYSAEVAIKSAASLISERTDGSDIFDWSQYTCHFRPHGVDDQRIQYDTVSEDLGLENSCKFGDLINLRQSLLTDGMCAVASDSDTDALVYQRAFKILGCTYNVANVDYFEVSLVSQALGKVFEGQLGKVKSKESILRAPKQCATFRNKSVMLTDREKPDRKVLMTVDLNLIGIHRADRLKKVLADSFCIVGLVFNSRTMHQRYEWHGLTQVQSDVNVFLWDTCRANLFPRLGIRNELLGQVQNMSQATKLHWKATPMLLAFVFEFILLRGQNDRLSYTDAVALDAVMDRWSRILGHLSEAKDCLAGILRGKKIPRLICTLFEECEWTGFEFLRNETTSGDSTNPNCPVVSINSDERQGQLRFGDLVNASVSFFKHCGVPVDLQLSNGQFVAATIARECEDDRFEVNVFAPIDSASDWNHVTVFVGPISREEDLEVSESGQHNRIYDIKRGRIGYVKHYDEKTHPQALCLIKYFDHLEPHEEWRASDSINTTFSNVDGSSLKMQLRKEDNVWVSGAVTPDNSLAHLPFNTSGKHTNNKTQDAPKNSRPGRIVYNHGNAKYDLTYLDGHLPSDETFVERMRLVPVTDRVMYDGTIVGIHLPSQQAVSSAATLNYVVRLKNGELVDNFPRNQLRLRTEYFAADAALIGATFIPKLHILDAGQRSEMAATMASRLAELWCGNDKIIKVYVTLPANVKSVQVRDATTNQIIHGNIMERSENQPRFLGQYHGYIKGETLDEAVATKLRKAYSAICKCRTSYSTVSAASFMKNNYFSLLIAPPPLTRLSGIIRVSPFSQSVSLFKTLLSATLDQYPASVMQLFQRQLRMECNANLPPRSKERRVIVETISVRFKNQPERDVVLDFTLPMRNNQWMVNDQKRKTAQGISMCSVSLDVKFQMFIPHNDQGSLADAVSNAFAEGTNICNRLQRIRSLILMSDGRVPSMVKGGVDSLPWSFETSGDDIRPSMALSVQFTNQNGDHDSTPVVSVELETLDDVRVSVQDDTDNVHNLHFPIHKVALEAKLRRQLSPFVKARVIQEPSEHLPSSSRNVCLEPNIRCSGDEASLSTCCVEFVATDPTNESYVYRVPKSDVRFDKLCVQVLKANELALKESMGTVNSIAVEVLLVSSDFQREACANPFGLVLSSSGEIIKDMGNNAYPKSSTFTLLYDRDQTAWSVDTTDSARKTVEFTYPSIDLDRVSEIKIKLTVVDKIDKNKKLIVGTASIPFSQINAATHSEVKSGNTELQQSFSVLRKDNGRMLVVGNISLKIERLQRFQIGTEVHARRLITDMDYWNICPRELLTMSLQQLENITKRSLLASIAGGQRILRIKPSEMELQLRKLVTVQLIFDALMLLTTAKVDPSMMPEFATNTYASATALTPHGLQHTLHQAKSFVEEAVQMLKFGGDKMTRKLSWASDPHIKKNEAGCQGDTAVMEANINTCASRIRHTVLRLHDAFAVRMLPKLKELYELDAQGEIVDVAACEELVLYFSKEVEDLEAEDQEVYQRVYQRSRLIKLSQVLEEVMLATVHVKVMEANSNKADKYLGTACIPLLDLLDQQTHDNMYQLLNIPSDGDSILCTAENQVKEANMGNVRLRLQLKFSEVTLLKEAVNVYKAQKAKCVAQYAEARRRINAVVVSTQYHRWTMTKGYLDELSAQSKGKLHWERTPLLLDLVWDNFITSKSLPVSSSKKLGKIDDDEQQVSEHIAQEVAGYRDSVVRVHNRWVNLQPMLEELRSLQACEKMNAQRTPHLLEEIEKEVDGLDAGLGAAWQQVQQKWKILFTALEELVAMHERKKLHLGRASQLLNIVDQHCSNGLGTRYADAVANVQLRWTAMTQQGGILTELRLMEIHTLHWSRTHEILLLIDEHYEGLADMDLSTLEVVRTRWLQVQGFLEDVTRMESEHTVDCEYTPFILKKINMWNAQHASGLGELSKPLPRSHPHTNTKSDASPVPNSASSQVNCFFDIGSDCVGQLEGMLEWYAIKEAKYELERKPYHRVTIETENKSLPPSATRLLMTQTEMFFSPVNVRLALEDRGVIPKTSYLDTIGGFKCQGTTYGTWISWSTLDSKSGSNILPKKLLDEIKELEGLLEKHGNSDQRTSAVNNPERVVELYLMIESLGKADLLQKVDHVLTRNCELTVPDSYESLLREMTIRQIPTTEVENLVKSLAFVLQKESMIQRGINVSATATTAELLQLMHQYQVKEVTLPQDISSIQTLLQERRMDRKGEPVLLRGVRIGTQAASVANRPTDKLPGAFGALNVGLGIIDTHVEMLRKTLLFEALRKRTSLAHTYPVVTDVFDGEVDELALGTAIINTDVGVSDGDYLALLERFQQLLVHEAYIKRLGEYAAQDRCMRALLHVPRDHVVTKEDIAIGLRELNDKTVWANYRLPVEAFTRDELLKAARAGHIPDPTEEVLQRCPRGRNAPAMAYYAAVSYAANAYQEATSFRSRVDPSTMQLLDTFPYKQYSNDSAPKDHNLLSFWQTPAKEPGLPSIDGPEFIEIQEKRLHLASAAFTLRNRWLQRGHGWCDNAFGQGVGVKVLLQRLRSLEAVDKMHMVETEALLKEVRDKCDKLPPQEQEAQAKLEEQYQSNLELLEDLVNRAERCLNKRKMHSEDTPVLLHKLEQVCVVPSGLNDRHREALHVVTTQWLQHRQHITELEEMQMQGVFNISRIPELLGQMKFHTEGKAESEELSRHKALIPAQKLDIKLPTNFTDCTIDEVCFGQRKEQSDLPVGMNTGESLPDRLMIEPKWNELSPIKRAGTPLSPRGKETNWKLVRNANPTTGSINSEIQVELEPKPQAHSRRKHSLGEEFKELLRLPTTLFRKPQEEKITPEHYYPREVTQKATRLTLPRQSK